MLWWFEFDGALPRSFNRDVTPIFLHQWPSGVETFTAFLRWWLNLARGVLRTVIGAISNARPVADDQVGIGAVRATIGIEILAGHIKLLIKTFMNGGLGIGCRLQISLLEP